MTPNAQHKRAERQRRTDKGDRRVELWMDRETQGYLDELMRLDKAPCEIVIAYAIQRLARPDIPLTITPTRV